MKSIFFVHTGNPFYLSLSLEQAKTSNPNTNIILLGDESNKGIKGINHYNVADYFERAKVLDKYYINYSPNARQYEIFCFQRWMAIWEFQQKHPEYDDSFVYCDTDTLLFDDVISDLMQMGDNRIALEGRVGPAFTFFNKGTLSDFCDTIEWFYMSKEGREYLANFIANNKESIHGFSDMYAFEYFVNQNEPKVIDAQVDFRGGGIA